METINALRIGTGLAARGGVGVAGRPRSGGCSHACWAAQQPRPLILSLSPMHFYVVRIWTHSHASSSESACWSLCISFAELTRAVNRLPPALQSEFPDLGVDWLSSALPTQLLTCKTTYVAVEEGRRGCRGQKGGAVDTGNAQAGRQCAFKRLATPLLASWNF